MIHLPSVICCSFIVAFLALCHGSAPDDVNGLLSDVKKTAEEKISNAKKFVDEVNKSDKNKGHWEAKYYERFAVLDEVQKKLFAGTKLDEKPTGRGGKQRKSTDGMHKKGGGANSTAAQTIAADEDQQQLSRARRQTLPASFDVRTKWPACVPFFNTIQDQSACGSCWAVSSASVLDDRVCVEQVKAGIPITTANDPNFRNSANHLLSCSGAGNCEQGGYVGQAWEWMVDNGLLSGTNYTWNSGCMPYPFPPSNTPFSTPACPAQCKTGWTLSKAESTQYREQIQQFNFI